MLEIRKDVASYKGHKMVEVFCGYCQSLSTMRRTRLKNARSCGCLKSIREYLVGQRFISKYGDTVEVISHENGSKVLIKFIDFDFYKEVRVNRLKSGDFENPIKVKYHTVGFISDPSVSRNPKYRKIKNIWLKMLSRCFDTNCKEYQFYGMKGVEVSDEWLNFNNFFNWYLLEIVDESFNYQIDKDLFSEDNKIYSPETCCLLPREINVALVRVEKDLDFSTPKRIRASISIYEDRRASKVCDSGEQARAFSNTHFRARLVELAEKYKDVISEKVYNKLKTFQAV